MDLDWLKDFSALAEHGNFSRAAEARAVTQPAFSRRIRALEDWIGTPLFERGAQGATLTAAGRHLQPLAEDLMRSLNKTRRDTKAAGEREAATLSIAATHMLSFTFFPGWIRKTLSLESFGTLNLISDSMEACEEILLAGEVNFLLCHAHPDTPMRLDPDRFPSVAVGDDILVPLCAPDAQRNPLWPIPGVPERPARWLAYSAASGLGRILTAQHAETAQDKHQQTVFTSHLAATLMTMAREGHGAAWLPLDIAEDDLKSGRLVRAGPNRFEMPVQIRLFRSESCRSTAADELWARLRA